MCTWGPAAGSARALPINQGTPGEPLRIGADTVIGSGAVVVANCEAGGHVCRCSGEEDPMRTLIIAEAGVNHNGDLALARKLVAAARGGRCRPGQVPDVRRRPQHFRRRRRKPATRKTDSGESQYEMVRKLELSRSDHEALIDECRAQGIGFFSTAFDVDSFALLEDLGLNLVKIPSGEITNLPLLQRMAASGHPILLSTGMSSVGEIDAALGVIEQAGNAALSCDAASLQYRLPDAGGRREPSRHGLAQGRLRRRGRLLGSHRRHRNADRRRSARRHGDRKALHARPRPAGPGPSREPRACRIRSHGACEYAMSNARLAMV
jgi:hypothetical protein